MTDWTDTPPTEAGERWWRKQEPGRGIVVDVFRGSRGLLVAIPGQSDFIPLSSMGGQWWPVPIPRPGEGTDWRAVAEDLMNAVRIDAADDEAQKFYDAAVARHTKGGT